MFPRCVELKRRQKLWKRHRVCFSQYSIQQKCWIELGGASHCATGRAMCGLCFYLLDAHKYITHISGGPPIAPCPNEFVFEVQRTHTHTHTHASICSSCGWKVFYTCECNTFLSQNMKMREKRRMKFDCSFLFLLFVLFVIAVIGWLLDFLFWGVYVCLLYRHIKQWWVYVWASEWVCMHN